MKDILTDQNNDLLILKGNFVFGESTLQHQKHILLAHKGAYKRHPKVGVGIKSLYDDENPIDLLKEAKKQFEDDGMIVKNIKLNPNGILTIDAKYK